MSDTQTSTDGAVIATVGVLAVVGFLAAVYFGVVSLHVEGGGATPQPSASEADVVTLTGYWPRTIKQADVRIFIGIGASPTPVDPIPAHEVTLITEKFNQNVKRWRWQRSIPATEAEGKWIYVLIRGPKIERPKSSSRYDYTCEIRRLSDQRGAKTSHNEIASCQFRY